MCISCVRYVAFLGSKQLFFVQVRHALGASLSFAVIFISQIYSHAIANGDSKFVFKSLFYKYFYSFYKRIGVSEIPVASLGDNEVTENF